MILDGALKGNKMENNKIDAKNYNYIILGMLIDIYALKMPRDIIKISMQDAWISTVLASIYAFIITCLLNFIIKKNENRDVFSINRRYYGRVLGLIINLIFAIQFSIYALSSANDFNEVYRIYATNFLTPFKMNIAVLGVSIYGASKGIKSMGKICKWVFYITVISIILPLWAINKGDIINVNPILQTPYSIIINGAFKAVYAYIGIEVILFLYPSVKNKKDMYRTSYKAISITTIMYTYIVFITLFFLGPDISIKYYHPFLAISENIKTPVLSSFRYIYVILWGFISFNTMMISFYVAITILKRITNKSKKIIFIYYLLILLSSIFISYSQKKTLFDLYTFNITVIFTIVYTAITFINSLIRKD